MSNSSQFMNTSNMPTQTGLDYVMFAVVRSRGSATAGYFLDWGATGVANANEYGLFFTALNRPGLVNGGQIFSNTTFAYSDVTTMYNALTQEPNTGGLHVFNISNGNRNIGPAGNASIAPNSLYSTGTLGCQWSTTSNFFNGDIYELIVYNNRFPFRPFNGTSAAQEITPWLLMVEGYLSKKWDISMTPSHPFKINAPVLRPFTPPDLDQLRLWMNSAEIFDLSLTGTTVTQWRDRSGLANNIPRTGANVGTLNSNGTLGRSLPTISLRTDACLNTINVAGFSGASPQTMVVLANTPSSGIVVSRGGTTTSIGALEIQVYSNRAVYDVCGGAVYGTASGLPTTRPKMVIATGTDNAATIFRGVRLYECGTLIASNLSFTPAQPNGNWNIRSTAAAAEIGEFIVYNSVLTDFERRYIEGYLAWKWDIVNSLPSSHSFRRIPPAIASFVPGIASNAQGFGLVSWLDAADRSTYDVTGTTVTRWRQKNVGSVFLPVTGANVGTFSSNGVVGTTRLPSIYVASSDMSVPLGWSTAANGQQTFVMVADTSGNLTGTMIRWFATPPNVGSAFTGSYKIDLTSNSASAVFNQVSGGGSITGGVLPTTRSKLVIGVHDSASNTIYEAGTAYTAAATTRGVGNGMLRLIAMHVGEVMVFSRGLVTSERQYLEGYLANKWGIPLPFSHPYYKNIP